MVMEWLFGHRKTPAELLRENKRMLDKAIRELDRERTMLQNEEKKLILEIKKMARDGQMPAVSVMAKSLVRNRHAVNKLFALKSQLQAVSLHMSTLKSTQAMADSMKGATKAMSMMNRRMNLPALAKITREFERQSMMMEETGEVLGDAIDDVTAGGEEEEETKDLVDQVLAEIGITAVDKLAAVPAAPQREQEAAAPQAVGIGAGGPPNGAGGDRGGPAKKPPPPPGGGGGGGGIALPTPPAGAPGGGRLPPTPVGVGADGGSGAPPPASSNDDLKARLDRLRRA